MIRNFNFGSRLVKVSSKEEKQAVIKQAVADGYRLGFISSNSYAYYQYVGYDHTGKEISAWHSSHGNIVVPFQEWAEECKHNSEMCVNIDEVMNLL